jgi:hypothetical protein
MAEFVRCPACGVRVQMSDALLGKHVRCPNCGKGYLAEVDVPVPPPAPACTPSGWPPTDGQLPLCPGCGHAVPWEVHRCPYCDEELELEGPARRGAGVPARRDWVPHRARLILTLGNLSLLCGGLSLCTAGIGCPVSVVLGLTAWALAQQDLEEMRAGRMDPAGQARTESGRAGGIVGATLGLLFGIFFAAVFLERWF